MTVDGVFYIQILLRRQTPLPPKHNHCCNPCQHCGGEVKLAFAAKKTDLSVDLAVRIEKKAVAKCNVYKHFLPLVAANLTARREK